MAIRAFAFIKEKTNVTHVAVKASPIVNMFLPVERRALLYNSMQIGREIADATQSNIMTNVLIDYTLRASIKK